MKLANFLKDKLVYLVLHTAVMLSTFIIVRSINEAFLYLATLLLVLYFIGIMIPLLIEYKKKKTYYDEILMIFENLTQKNLISEMIRPSEFIESRILYDLLSRSNKAYLDEINRYKMIQQEYREYIELWVHEIKTPIASSKLILQNHGNPITKSVGEELDKIEDLIKQVLFYSRSNNVDRDYFIKTISLSGLCAQAVKRHARLLIANNVSVEIECGDICVLGDSKWLGYILDQLIVNAVKYAQDSNSRISIKANKYENQVTLSVSDNGIGIAENEISKIFDKGFTGSNGRENEQSTGMGLYICKKLCDKLGLSIYASEAHPNGVTIDILFPLNSMTDVM